ncbi:hypothetical protein BVRB_021680, partial [Beta vulgaris subsp. vulgaris]
LFYSDRYYAEWVSSDRRNLLEPVFVPGVGSVMILCFVFFLLTAVISVEFFASSMCKDYGLTGDWAAKVAFDIRWALLEHRKAVHTNNLSPFERRSIGSEISCAPITSVYQSYSEDVLQTVVQS